MVILVHDYFLTLVFLLLTVFHDNVHSFMYTYAVKVLQLLNLYEWLDSQHDNLPKRDTHNQNVYIVTMRAGDG